MIIYLITNRLNSKSYVGQTVRSFENRWVEHCIPSRLEFPIDRAIKKYGKENFETSTISKAETLDELNALEILYIQFYDTLSPKGYNLHTGGLNHQVSEETRQKMSESHKGKKLSPIHIANILKGNGGNKTWLGKHLSEEHRAKLRISSKAARAAKFWSSGRKKKVI